MASQTLKQRPRDEPTPTPSSSSAAATDGNKNRRAKKVAMARRGLRSLAVAVAAPLALTLLTLYIFGTDVGARAGRPFWRPPAWAFFLASTSCSSLMSLAAWLVWAEGGFHQRPAALAFYVAQQALGLAWAPLVLGAGAPRAGLGVCAALVAALLGCSQCFKSVNPIAGDLVKPCLAWAAFLAIFNYKLV